MCADFYVDALRFSKTSIELPIFCRDDISRNDAYSPNIFHRKVSGIILNRWPNTRASHSDTVCPFRPRQAVLGQTAPQTSTIRKNFQPKLTCRQLIIPRLAEHDSPDSLSTSGSSSHLPFLTVFQGPKWWWGEGKKLFYLSLDLLRQFVMMASYHLCLADAICPGKRLHGSTSSNSKYGTSMLKNIFRVSQFHGKVALYIYFSKGCENSTEAHTAVLGS